MRNLQDIVADLIILPKQDINLSEEEIDRLAIAAAEYSKLSLRQFTYINMTTGDHEIFHGRSGHDAATAALTTYLLDGQSRKRSE